MATSKRSACFYQNGRVFTQQNELSTRTIFQHPTGLLAQLNAGTKAGHSLVAVNNSNTVATLCGPNDNEHRSYTAYGQYLAHNELHNPMAFNGEPLDLATGCYYLGNGYRLFNPILMRFISPDSLSPFARGGVNAYTYCVGDPINNLDPSGHFFSKISALWSQFSTIGKVFMGATLVSAGATLATAIAYDNTKSEKTREKLLLASIVSGGLTLAFSVAGAGTGIIKALFPTSSAITPQAAQQTQQDVAATQNNAAMNTSTSSSQFHNSTYLPDQENAGLNSQPVPNTTYRIPRPIYAELMAKSSSLRDTTS